jgi:hypothetical protein
VTYDAFDELQARNPIPDPHARLHPHHDPAAQALLERVLIGRADPTTCRRRDQPLRAIRATGSRDDDVEQRVAAVVERALDEASRGAPVGRRRRRRYVIPGVLVVTMTTAAASWVVTRPADEPTSVACYSAVDLHADVAVVAPVADDPAGACIQVWRNGLFKSPAEPLLQPCVLESGVIGVFPVVEGDPCSRLGLDRPSDPASHASIISVHRRIAHRLLVDCVSVDDAVKMVQGELRFAGLRQWSVVEAELPPLSDSCALADVDTPHQTFTVVPVQRDRSG